MSRIIGSLMSAMAVFAVLVAPPAQAADPSDCAFNSQALRPYPAPVTPDAAAPKFTFKGPKTVALGQRYAFTFSTAPADAEGALYLSFGSGESRRFGQWAVALDAKVVDGKVLDANGRPLDIPMLRVHPTLTYPGTTAYLWASFRDSATGKYVCKKSPVTVTAAP